MVSCPQLPQSGHLLTLPPFTDPYEPMPSYYRIPPLLASAPSLRTLATNRDRATIRARLVCRHGDMFGHDYLPG